MKKTAIACETDQTWMKFADLLVETGIISECIEKREIQENLKGK